MKYFATPRYRMLQLTAFYVLIGVLIFSYIPTVTLGTIRGLHIDISLLYIAVIFFVLINIPAIIRSYRDLVKIPALALLAIFNSYISISIFWSDNLPRALFTAGFFWLLFGLLCSIAASGTLFFSHPKRLKQIGVVMTLIVCSFALWQIFGDAFNISQAFTLLPNNYTSSVFGVARPTGFALEPQFFGSLLLIPFTMLLHASLRSKQRLLLALLFLVSVVLFLTISRGALLAALVSTLILLGHFIAKNKQKSLRHVSLPILILLIAPLVGFLLQYAAASINTRDTISGRTTVDKTLSQLTLGKIRFAPTSSASKTTNLDTAAPDPSTSFVRSSSSSRLSMSAQAVHLWQSTPGSMLFGVGIGGFGARLHKVMPSFQVGSVVNNFYFELLAETGIIGAILFILFIASLIRSVFKRQSWLLAALLAGSLVQWTFFSGNANIVHVWVVFGCIAALTSARFHFKKSAILD